MRRSRAPGELLCQAANPPTHMPNSSEPEGPGSRQVPLKNKRVLGHQARVGSVTWVISHAARAEAQPKPSTIATHRGRNLPSGSPPRLGHQLSRDELYAAVRAAAAGETTLAPKVASRVLDQMRGADPTALTRREIDVLRLVAAGRRNREIAHHLHVGEATVRTHLLHIFEKLGVDDRTHAVTVALERGTLRIEHQRSP